MPPLPSGIAHHCPGAGFLPRTPTARERYRTLAGPCGIRPPVAFGLIDTGAIVIVVIGMATLGAGDLRPVAVR